ncbi:uncharacterized protein LOC131648816 [Vicia villosa]|uniref:uncharacterized protein LOC131648816 n=1 Tax=Vicia villosa TaxID=3911 RepID=UPI00273A7D5D|nr:uncharacterized protein LOC131648816 [Vicia villosa]
MDTMLGFSRIKKGYYTGIGKKVEIADLAKALEVPAADLEPNYKTDDNVHGIRRSYLEAQAMLYAQKKQWDICRHFLALLIFGVILLPKKAEYVDHDAIHVFTSFRVSDVDPTPTILANIYYTIHTRCEKKRGMLFCCVHLLYSWLTSHIYKANYLVKDLTRHEWSQKLRALKADSIFWYARKQNYERIIYKCGDFPNVPLIGTLGCINYNPVLALRQLGHSMDDEPSKQQVEELILHDMGKGDPRTLKKVIQAWKSVQTKKFGPKNVIAKEPYTRWGQERVGRILLPFIVDPVLEHAGVEIANWKRYYEQASRDKKESEENLETMIFELTIGPRIKRGK